MFIHTSYLAVPDFASHVKAGVLVLVTIWPLTGESTLKAAMVYEADATAESTIPGLVAIAFIVFVEETLMAPVYVAEDAFGVEPSVVYLMVAPDVAHEMVTFCVTV
jgi:hypothetical protein